MRSRLLLLIVCGVVPLVLGCNQVSGPEVTNAPLAIRIGNDTNRAFDGVVVGFPEQREVYGRISAHSVSAYRSVGKAYRYAYVEIKLGVEKAVIQPTDYMGETPLEPGRYTYRMTLAPNPTSQYDRVLLELVVDP